MDNTRYRVEEETKILKKRLRSPSPVRVLPPHEHQRGRSVSPERRRRSPLPSRGRRPSPPRRERERSPPQKRQRQLSPPPQQRIEESTTNTTNPYISMQMPPRVRDDEPDHSYRSSNNNRESSMFISFFFKCLHSFCSFNLDRSKKQRRRLQRQKEARHRSSFR